MIQHIIACLSGRDNKSIDVGRVLLTFNMAALVLLEAWQVVVRKGAFDAVSFAAACGGLMTAGSAALFIKKGTEP